MSKKILVITIIAVLTIAVVVTGLVLGLNMHQQTAEQSEQHSSPYIPAHQMPENGSEIVVMLGSGHEDGSGVEGVEVTFTDKSTGNTLTEVTGQDGIAEFSLIWGNTYAISATFGNSSSSVEHTLENHEVIGVLISQQDTIESIVFETIPDM